MSDCKSCSWTDTVGNFGKAVGRAVTSTVKGQALFVSKAIADSRKAICDGCEFKDELRCKLCGCFISAKTMLTTESCPEGKW